MVPSTKNGIFAFDQQGDGKNKEFMILRAVDLRAFNFVLKEQKKNVKLCSSFFQTSNSFLSLLLKCQRREEVELLSVCLPTA